MADKKLTRSSSAKSDSAKKIESLRTWMKAHKIDAYLVPHSDRYQSEYLPSSDERLAWLTGFTGSAGMSAILNDNAILFTDGRYTLQAAQQVDSDHYDIVESPPNNPMETLVQHLEENAEIGFDPLLFTVAQISIWRKAASKENWILVPINENPIDLLWQDKPVEPIIPAENHPIEFAGISTEDKINAILEKKVKNAEHILITDPSLVCWLLNMRGRDVAHTPLVQSMALLDKDGQVILFADAEKITPELRGIWGNHVGVEDISRLYDVLAKITAPLQIDPTQCPFAVKDFCEDKNITLIEAIDPATLLRAAKNDTEINGAIKAHEIDAIAFKDFFGWFNAIDFTKEKITELDIVQRLHEARETTGQCLDESFDTIAGFGPNGAIVHYRADENSNLQLQNGNLLLLDSGGQYRCGTTDVTRTLAIGTPTSEMKKHFTAVLKGLIALSTTRFPVGISGGQMDAIARAHVWAVGIDYAHGTGHGVGSFLSVHEGPQRFSNGNTVALQPGMILSIEPGIYLNGQYGIRLENLVVVVKDERPGDIKPMLALKTLTKIPFDETLIDFSMLSHSEQEFLKQFQNEK